jgi:hypothetical protein
MLLSTYSKSETWFPSGRIEHQSTIYDGLNTNGSVQFLNPRITNLLPYFPRPKFDALNFIKRKIYSTQRLRFGTSLN